ncbi:MAG: transposase family protein, partial [Gammaproteobacteria bacterium]|nr:transposase family protein [Gammaproteobacteria bacterium]
QVLTIKLSNPYTEFRTHSYRIMRDLGLLQRRVRHQAELHQSRQLFELLPTRPNELWQMDVTYLHLPQGRWWYIVSVIDYYSRYLLTCFLTPFQNATAVSQALELAIQESARLHGPLQHAPILVTDNGSCFLARRFQDVLRHRFRHVRIQYRTPQQLGLLERFHGTLKKEEVYFRIYEHPNHARQCLEEFRHRYITRCARIGLYGRRKMRIRGLQPKSMSRVTPSSFRNGRDGQKPPKRNSRNNWKEPTDRVSQHAQEIRKLSILIFRANYYSKT